MEVLEHTKSTKETVKDEKVIMRKTNIFYLISLILFIIVLIFVLIVDIVALSSGELSEAILNKVGSGDTSIMSSFIGVFLLVINVIILPISVISFIIVTCIFYSYDRHLMGRHSNVYMWLLIIIILLGLGIIAVMSVLAWRFYHSIFIIVNYAFVLVSVGLIDLTCGIILAYIVMNDRKGM